MPLSYAYPCHIYLEPKTRPLCFDRIFDHILGGWVIQNADFWLHLGTFQPSVMLAPSVGTSAGLPLTPLRIPAFSRFLTFLSVPEALEAPASMRTSVLPQRTGCACPCVGRPKAEGAEGRRKRGVLSSFRFFQTSFSVVRPSSFRCSFLSSFRWFRFSTRRSGFGGSFRFRVVSGDFCFHSFHRISTEPV